MGFYCINFLSLLLYLLYLVVNLKILLYRIQSLNYEKWLWPQSLFRFENLFKRTDLSCNLIEYP